MKTLHVSQCTSHNRGFTPTPEQNRLVCGFTLVEALIAIFIIGVALTGALSIITSQTIVGYFIQNSFIASGLAQEGIEVVRNIRDTDIFAGNPFGALGSPPGPAVGTYRVEWNSASLMALSGNPVLQKDADGMYGYANGGSDTIFRRSILVSYPNADEMRVIASVSWRERTGQKSLSAEEHLFNWNK